MVSLADAGLTKTFGLLSRPFYSFLPYLIGVIGRKAIQIEIAPFWMRVYSFFSFSLHKIHHSPNHE